MASFRGLVRRLRHAAGLPNLPEIDPRLASMERVFRAPPLTPELVAAIRLISPHCKLTTSEQCRKAWEADQNGACWGEYEALAPLFQSLPKPARVLEIGPGMGRSLVFFSKQLGWQDSELHAYEGDGTSTKYMSQGPRFEDSFCGNIAVLRTVLDYNGVSNVTLFDAHNVHLTDLPGPYDLLYSIYSIGFHWSLEPFLDDLLPLLHDRSVAVFTVPPEFEPFAAMQGLNYKTISWKTAWPKDGWLKLLVLSKGMLPSVSN